jgi:hypothetical protein
MVPAFLAMIFPPLIMLFFFPAGPLLTFLALLGIIASYESIVSERRRTAEPGAPPNGGPATLLASSEVTDGPPSVS